MDAPRTHSIPPSIPVGSGLFVRALEIVGRLEALPAHAVGALRFGQHGVVLVESRAVSWAEAAGMQQRFAQIIRHQRSPPLERTYLQDLYRQCKDDQTPFVEALLASGAASPEGLRVALFRHVAEAIAHLALRGARCEGFTPNARFQARFSFSPSEILAGLGARNDPALAVVAEGHLAATLVPETSGWAFLRDAGQGGPVVIAVAGGPALRGAEMFELSVWAAGLFDVTTVFDDDVRVASASFEDGRNIVAWRRGDVYYAAACANRAGSARLVAALDAKLVSEPSAPG